MQLKPNHKNTVCHKCGTKDTYIDPNRGPDWRRYKDKYGNWDGKSYLCYGCYFNIGKPRISKHENTVCCKCGGKDTYINNNGKINWLRNYDEKGQWDRKSYLCTYCYDKRRQSLPDSQNNLMKSIANCRTGNVSIYDEKGKGIIGQAVAAKTLKIEDLNIKMDNFIYAIDLGRHCEHGYIEVKTRTLKNGKWSIRSYQMRDFDNILILCMDTYEPWKDVERVYIIPWAEAIKRSGLTIVRDPSRDVWYYEFRVDEKPFNDNYHSLISYLNDRKYFGVEDIKKWLKL